MRWSRKLAQQPVTFVAPIGELAVGDVTGPIMGGPSDSEIRGVANLQRELSEERWKMACRYLAQLPMVHMARLQIIDHLIPGMGQARMDRLAARYLMFVAEIDGHVDDFLDAAYYLEPQAPSNTTTYPVQAAGDDQVHPASLKNVVYKDVSAFDAYAMHEAWPTTEKGSVVRRLFGWCRGFPDQGELSLPSFRGYFKRHIVAPGVTYAACDESVTEIKRALLISDYVRCKLPSMVQKGNSLALGGFLSELNVLMQSSREDVDRRSEQDRGGICKRNDEEALP